MNKGLYSPELHVQIIIALLKKYGIKNIIASPGATNVSFVASLQKDPFFSIYSAPDERSAAYIACGMAEETNKPVVITCTGATSSRNYMPGLTEAYYRKLPILAITASPRYMYTGHLRPQFMDRTVHPNDLVVRSVQLPEVKDKNDEWDCIIKVNQALTDLTRRSGGPVHINYVTVYPSFDNYVESLPDIKKIEHYCYETIGNVDMPKGRICIFVGSHLKMSEDLTNAIDRFCSVNNAVVFCDQTSGYHGKYKVPYSLVASQALADKNLQPDLLIHIGEISGDYYTTGKLKSAKHVCRVSEDGEIRDYFGKLSSVFEMSELFFFEHFSNGTGKDSEYYDDCRRRIEEINKKDVDVPFSNIWVASKLYSLLPKNSVLHLGILNSLRAWNFFELDPSIDVYSNVGGFGIDGGMSTMLGASIASPERLFYGVFGDLAFFYDMNCLGNRHVGKNLRILLINNGKGTEFRNYSHSAAPMGDDADKFVAAAGHYGNKSQDLVKHYSEDLGFKYISANSKESFMEVYPSFVDDSVKDKSIIFEIFTDSKDESDALKAIRTIETDIKSSLSGVIKSTVKTVLPKSIIDKLR